MTIFRTFKTYADLALYEPPFPALQFQKAYRTGSIPITLLTSSTTGICVQVHLGQFQTLIKGSESDLLHATWVRPLRFFVGDISDSILFPNIDDQP